MDQINRKESPEINPHNRGVAKVGLPVVHMEKNAIINK